MVFPWFSRGFPVVFPWFSESPGSPGSPARPGRTRWGIVPMAGACSLMPRRDRVRDLPWWMVNLWWIYGEFMVNLWWFYGEFMVNLWWIYGLYMKNIWRIYGECMVNVWWISLIYIYGLCMVYKYDEYMLYLYMVYMLNILVYMVNMCFFLFLAYGLHTYWYSLDNYKLYPLVLVNHNDLSATSLGSMVYLRKLIPFYGLHSS